MIKKRKSSNKKGFVIIEYVIIASIIIVFGSATYPNLAKSGLLGVDQELKYSKTVTDTVATNNENFDPTHSNFSILASTKLSTNTIIDEIDQALIPNPSDAPEDEEVTNPVTGFNIIPASKTATLYPGETLQIQATVNPPTVSNKNVRWVSFNPAIATVNQAGVVTGVKPGEATIQVQAIQNGKADNIIITVLPVYPTETTLKPTATRDNPIQIYVNESRLLTFDYKPANATNLDCFYESSKPDFLRIDASPIGVTALNSTSNKIDNIVEISMKCQDQNGNFAITSSTFFEIIAKTIDTTEIAVPTSYKEIEIGDTYNVGASVIPSNASVQALSYTSSNTTVATVDSTGTVRGTSVGETYITIKNYGGDVYGSEITKLVRIKVNPKTIPLKSFSFSYLANSFMIGEYLSPMITYNPTNTSQTDLVWTSNNPSVITVNQYGQISSKSVGTSTITAQSVYNPTLTYSVTIESKGIYDPVQSVSFDKGKYTLLPGENTTVSVIIYPSFATNKSIQYSVKDPTVALIDQNGNLRALRPGLTEITAKTLDSGCSTSFCSVSAVVEVSEVGVESVSLDTKQSDSKVLNIGLNEEGKVWLNIYPENASDTAFILDYVNDGVIRVERENVYDSTIPMITVTGLNYGTRTLKVTSINGKQDIITINVIKRIPTSIEILPNNNGSMTLNKGSQTYLTANVLPANADIKTVVWSTSDSSVVSINQNGLITGIKSGTATITCTSNDPDAANISTSINVHVPATLLSYVEADTSGIYSNKGSLINVRFTVFDPLADNTKLIIKSLDESIIKVKTATRQPNASGQLYIQFEAMDIGNTQIEITSEDGGIAEPLILPVNITTNEIFATNMTSDDNRNISLANGENFQTNITLNPTTVTNPTIKFESSNTTIASVSNSGLITAITPGECTIIATSNSNPDLVLTYYVKVIGIPASAIDVTPSYIVLNTNELHGSTKQNLAFTLTPQNSTYNQYGYEVISSTTRTTTYVTEGGETVEVIVRPTYLDLTQGYENVVAVEKGRIVYKIFPYQDSSIFTTLTIEVTDNSIPWDGVTISPDVEVENGACRIYNGENLAYLGELSKAGTLSSKCSTISILNNIDLGGHLFDYSFDLSIPFYGNGNTIEHAQLNTGFFNVIQASSVVRDIHFNNVVGNFVNNGGLFANEIRGKVQFCTVTNSEVNSVSSADIQVGILANSIDGAQISASTVSDVRHGNGSFKLYGVAISSNNSILTSVGVDNIGESNDVGYIGSLINTSSSSIYVNSQQGYASNRPYENVSGTVKFTNGYFSINNSISTIGADEFNVTFSDFYMTSNVLEGFYEVRDYSTFESADFVDELNRLTVGWFYQIGKTAQLLATETETVRYLRFVNQVQTIYSNEPNQSLNLAYVAYPTNLNDSTLFESFSTSDESILKLNPTTGAIEFVKDDITNVYVYVNYKNDVRAQMIVKLR